MNDELITPPVAPRRDRPAGHPQRYSALAGAVATAAGLGAAAVVGQFTGADSAPVAALGERIIALLPGPMINFGKETLGFADKPILLAIITVVALLLGAGAAVLEYRRSNLGWAVIGPVAILCLVAAIISSSSNPVIASLASIVAVGVSVALIKSLVVRIDRVVEEPGPATRRTFFQWIAGSSVGAVATWGSSQALAAGGPASAAGSDFPLPTPTVTDPVPAGADLEIPQLSSYLTPNDDFYRIDTALVVPRLNADRWQLSITGLVQNPLTLSFAELLAKPMIEHTATLTCVSNEVGGGLVGNAVWLGHRLRDLLALAKPLPEADMVLSRASDGWTAGTPLAVLIDPDRECLLAVGMNGQPLPREHGYPVRMVVPGLYGYVSATKWVVELKLTTFAADQGYWTPLGWSALGPIKLASRIEVPGASAQAGPVVIAGTAWSQHIGIQAVEVQVDQQPWQRAELAEVTGPDTWRQWHWTWNATPGEHTVRCRAQDANGEWQTEKLARPDPDGATGWHTRTVTVTG